jgi:hypothetical protein
VRNDAPAKIFAVHRDRGIGRGLTLKQTFAVFLEELLYESPQIRIAAALSLEKVSLLFSR